MNTHVSNYSKQLNPRPAVGPDQSLLSRMEKTVFQRQIDRAYAQTLLDSMPEFQRGFQRNKKFEEVKDYIVARHEIPGELTIGILDGMPLALDCQHRIHAFLDTDLESVKVTVVQFTNGSYQDYAREFTLRNSQIRALDTNDRLRGMAPNLPLINKLVNDFPFMSFAAAKSGDNLSVSTVLSTWNKATQDTPSATNPVAEIASVLTDSEYLRMAAFIQCAHRAWGDPVRSNKMLWSSLTLTMTAWLYRRVVEPVEDPARKVTKIDDLTFSKCLMGVAADPTFSDWVVGRRLGRRDRGPAYNRVKEIFVQRLRHEYPERKNINLPQPRWSRGAENVKGKL